MPHDPQKVADTREWLRKALEDLQSADVLLHASPPLAGPAAFHCQGPREIRMPAGAGDITAPPSCWSR
jgi:hypothetical protein